MRYRQSEQLNITPLEVVENTPQTLVALAFEPRGGGAKPPDGKERGVVC